MTNAFDSAAFSSDAFDSLTPAEGTIYPVGFASSQFGSPTAFTRQFIDVNGVNTSGLGTPELTLLLQFVQSATAGNQAAYGTPNLYNLNQILSPQAIPSHIVFGTAFASNQYRDVLANGLAPSNVFGTAWVSSGIRTVYPNGTPPSNVFGTANASNLTRYVQPAGEPHTAFGVAVVSDRAQTLYPTGIPRARVGDPWVYYRTRTIQPRNWDSAEYGLANAYLSRQYIRTRSDPNWYPEASRFGTAYAKNINQEIGVNGFDSFRSRPDHYVYTNGQVLAVRGTDTSEFGTADVSNWVRAIQLSGIDTLYIPVTHAMYNSATIIDLGGWGFRDGRLAAGHYVYSNQQTIRASSDTLIEAFGNPRVSESPQTLQPVGKLTEIPGYHDVSFGVRTIAVGGIDQGYPGIPIVYGWYNVVKTWGNDFGAVGYPEVHNVTPEVKPNGALTDSYGRPTVQLWVRTVSPQGTNMAVVERPTVSFRTRTLLCNGSAMAYYGNAYVHFDPTQQPPGQQVISNTQGQNFTVVPLPLVRKPNTIEVSGGAYAQFGGCTVSTSGVIVVDKPVDAVIDIGTPTIIGGLKTIRPTGWLSTAVAVSHKVVGPQVIDIGRDWSPGPPGSWYTVDRHTYGNPAAAEGVWLPQTAGPVFGQGIVVTYYTRTLSPIGANTAALGVAKISTDPQFIRPTGVQSFRRGIPDVFISELQIVYPFGSDTSSFGEHVIDLQDIGDKYISAATLGEPPGFGTPRVDNFNRTLLVNGWDSAQLGTPPYVGPPLPIYPNSTDDAPNAVVGVPWVSMRIRTVVQLHVVDSRPEQVGRPILKHEPRAYYIEGTPSVTSFGAPRLSFPLQVLSAHGWVEFETGLSYVPAHYPGYSKVKTQTFIASPGVDSGVFGVATIGF